MSTLVITWVPKSRTTIWLSYVARSVRFSSRWAAIFLSLALKVSSKAKSGWVLAVYRTKRIWNQYNKLKKTKTNRTFQWEWLQWRPIPITCLIKYWSSSCEAPLSLFLFCSFYWFAATSVYLSSSVFVCLSVSISLTKCRLWEKNSLKSLFI